MTGKVCYVMIWQRAYAMTWMGEFDTSEELDMMVRVPGFLE